MWIKICGITAEDAIAAALEARADAVGFIFAPSVRRLTPQQAARLAAPARGRVHLIAVGLHPEQSLVDEIIAVLKPDALQTDRIRHRCVSPSGRLGSCRSYGV